MTLYRLLLLLCLIIFLARTKGVITLFQHKNPVFNFLPIMLAYSVVTVLWSKNFSDWFHGFFFVASATIAQYLFAYYSEDDRIICNCLQCFGVSVAIQAAFGTLEYFTGTYLFLRDERLFMFTRYGNYPVAMMGNVNNFGILMVAGICVEYLLIKKTDKLPFKVMHLFILAWYAFLCYQSSSRGALLAIVVILIFFFVFFTQKISMKLVTLISLLSVALYTYVYVSDRLSLNTIIFSDDIRTKLALNGVHFLLETFFLGTGSGQADWWFKNKSIIDCGGITIYHNLAIELLATYGIIIFVLFVRVYAMGISRFFRFGRYENGNRQNLAQFFCLFLVGLIVGSITSSSMITQEWFWLIWVLMVCFYGKSKYSN